MRLAEIFVAIRGDGKELPRDMRRAFDRAGSGQMGQEEGHKFTKGFGRGLSRLVGVAGAALGALAIGNTIKESVAAASDLNETVSKTQQVFGKSAAAVIAYGNKAPTAIGQTKQAALDANATFGLFGKTAGLSGNKLVGFTTQFTTLASDLASFNNTTPEQAIEALGAAFRGENEPIRAYSVLLDDATLKAEAMRLGLVKTTGDTNKIQAAQLRAELAQKKYNAAVKEHGKDSAEAKAAQAGLLTATSTMKRVTEGTIPPLTQQQKIMAASSAIMRQTTVQQGDFARTAGGLANQQRIAAAQTNTLKVAIGNALLPVVLQGATALTTQLMPPLISLAQKHGPAVAAVLGRIASDAGPALASFFSDLGPKVKSFADGTNQASPALSSLADSGAKLAPVVKELISKIPSLTDALNVGAHVISFFADHTGTLTKLMPLMVAGLVAFKVAQLAANLAQTIAVPTKVAEVVVNRQLVRSNRELIASRTGVIGSTIGQTVATSANTGATAANSAAAGRGRIATLAYAAAERVATVAKAAGAIAARVLSVAMTFALGPVGLVIAAIALLAAGIIILWKRSETFRSIVTGVFNAFRNIAITVVRAVWDVISGFFGNLLTGASKAFGWVPKIGDKLRTAATEFGKFKTSVNRQLDGLRDQKVSVTAELKSWGTPELLAMAHGRAAGGPGGAYDGGFKVRGPGGPTDDKAGIYALSNKEWVIRAKASAKYGDYAMASVNRGDAEIIPRATGGRAGVNVQNLLPSTTAVGAAKHNVDVATRYIGLEVARAMSKNLAKAMVAPGLVPTLNWAKTQVGKPYGWGAVGPGAYDCSGWVSALVNRAYGRPPHRRLGATGSMPWASMTSGKGPFMIGWFTGNPGHTAATINGVNLESSGGVGVHMGRGARGANHPMFNHRMKVKGFARGGRVGEGRQGDAPFDFIDPRGKHFLGRDFLREMGIKVMDRGGRWESGTLAANLSGHDETVVAGGNGSSVDLSGSTVDAFERAMRRAFGQVMTEGRFRLARSIGSDSYVLQMTQG